MANTKGGLTDRQKAFVREYLVDLNATQAAIRAGYSAKTAEAQGSRLLTNVKVANAVNGGMSKREKRTLITQDDVIKGLMDEATKEGEGCSHGARVSAWGHLGKHLGMFKDQVEHSGGVTVTKITRKIVRPRD